MRTLNIESLPCEEKNWIDRDHIMLHACFQILEDSIVKEGVDTHCNYETYKETVDEIRFLNDWWQKRKEKESHNDFDGIDKDDDEMLIRLMKIRCFLWT